MSMPAVGVVTVLVQPGAFRTCRDACGTQVLQRVCHRMGVPFSTGTLVGISL